MPRLARLLTQWQKKEITQLFRTAKRSMVHAGLDIRLAPRSLSDYSRILIVIPRKVGSAPIRNLLRRRIKAIFFEEQLYQKPFDWLILARQESTTLSFPDLKKIIEQVAPQQQAKLQ